MVCDVNISLVLSCALFYLVLLLIGLFIKRTGAFDHVLAPYIKSMILYSSHIIQYYMLTR